MTAKEDEVLVSAKNGVTTLTMNRPKTLNSWTQSMMEELFKNMKEAASDSATKVFPLNLAKREDIRSE